MLVLTLRPGATLAIWGPRLNRRVLGRGDLPKPGCWKDVADDGGRRVGRLYRERCGEAGKAQPVVKIDLPEAFRVERSDAGPRKPTKRR